MPRDRNGSGFALMMVLAMAPTSPRQLPTIVFNFLDQVSYFQDLVPQRFPGLQRELNPLLRLLLPAQRLKTFAFQVEQVLFAYRHAWGNVAATEDFRDFCRDLHVVIADVLCLSH